MSRSFDGQLGVVIGCALLMATLGCGGGSSAAAGDMSMGSQGVVDRPLQEEVAHQSCRTAPTLDLSPTYEGADCKTEWVLESRLWEPRPVVFADTFGGRMQWVGETLWVFDTSRRRLSAFRMIADGWSRSEQILLDDQEFREDGVYRFAINKDTLIIGSYDYGSGEYDGPGRLLVYRRHEGTWTAASVAAPPDTSRGFGRSVALAPPLLATNDVTLKTPAYIFEYTDKGWELVFTTPRKFDKRRPLALQPNLLAIGGSGELHVFARYAGQWHEQTLKPPAEYSEFGSYYFLEGPHLWTFSRVVKLTRPGGILAQSLHADRYAWKCRAFEHDQTAKIEWSSPEPIVSDPMDLRWPWLAVALEDEDWQKSYVDERSYRDPEPPRYQHRKVAILAGSERGFRQVAELEPEIPEELFTPFFQPSVSVDTIAVGAEHMAVTMHVGEPFNPNLEGMRMHGIVFIYRRVCADDRPRASGD